MKTAIYIEDGLVQLVLTPENDFERNALNGLAGREPGPTWQQPVTLDAEVRFGSFGECRGGWTRRFESGESLILSAHSSETQRTDQ